MKLSRDAIQRLLTKEEAEFIETLAVGRIEATTPARLRQKLGRARRLRDKYRDLARRQRAETRGKAAPRRSRPSRSNANTLRKVQIFEWAIGRISERLDAAGAKVGEPAEDRKRGRADHSVTRLRPRIAEVLEESGALSFGDLWAAMPDVPVHRLREALWELSEEGVLDLTDDAGVALASEAEVAEDVDVEVDIDRPAPRATPRTPKPAAAREGKPVPGSVGHHPKVRIRGHVKARGRRSQARRDRRG